MGAYAPCRKWGAAAGSTCISQVAADSDDAPGDKHLLDSQKGHLDTESIGLTPRSGYLIRLASSSGVLLLCRARYFYYLLINGLRFSTMFYFLEEDEMDAYFH
jgi:hypothetical protein